MKKYFFAILFFLGCLFIDFNIDNNVVNAQPIVSMEADSYDSRKITIKLEGLNARTNSIRIDEVIKCNASDDGCTSDGVKIIPNTSYTPPSNGATFTSTTFEYQITTPNDGIKYFYIQMSGVSHFETTVVEYKLSTKEAGFTQLMLYKS